MVIGISRNMQFKLDSNFSLTFHIKITDNEYVHMLSKDKNELSIMQQYVMHLRYRLLHYQLEGIDPPEYLFNELELAKTLVRIDKKTKNS